MTARAPWFASGGYDFDPSEQPFTAGGPCSGCVRPNCPAVCPFMPAVEVDEVAELVAETNQSLRDLGL